MNPLRFRHHSYAALMRKKPVDFKQILQLLDGMIFTGQNMFNSQYTREEQVDYGDRLQERYNQIEHKLVIMKSLIKNLKSQTSTKFVVRKPNGSLNWESLKPEKKDKKTQSIRIDSIYDVKIPVIDLPVADTLKSIPLAIRWFKGDSKKPTGAYIRISRNLCVKIPFPDVISNANYGNKIKSIRCRYGSAENCIAERKYRYNDVRPCTYAHHGDTYNKINFAQRCRMPFGQHSTLLQDIYEIPVNDIKMILFYALSDLLLINIWGNANDIDAVLTDIETVEA